MKSVLVIAVLALTGFSLASAASLHFDDNEIPESIEDLKDSLQALLRDVSEKFKEDAHHFEDFDEKNMLVDVQSPLVTVEKESDAKANDLPTEVISTGSDDEGIHCSWHSLSAICCQTVHFHIYKLPICVKASIRPGYGVLISVMFNGNLVWHHWVLNHHRYQVCWNGRHIRICLIFSRVYVSSHYARLCLLFHARYHSAWTNVNLGCIIKRYAEVETADGSPLKLTQAEKDEDIFSVPKENMQTDEIFKFDQ